jgi:hypothetical protein
MSEVIQFLNNNLTPLLTVVGAVLAFYGTVRQTKKSTAQMVITTSGTDWEELSKSRNEALGDERDKNERLEAKIMALEIRNDELERRCDFLWEELEARRKQNKD